MNQIKNIWIVSELNNTATNIGTVKLLQKGFDYIESDEISATQKAQFYLNQYKKIEASKIQDYFDLIQYLQTPNLTVTSE